MFEFLGLQPAASEHSHEIDHLMISIHYLMFALFVGWTIFYIYSLIRFRAGKNPKASYQGMKSNFPIYLVFLVALLELFDLIGYSIPFWAKANDNFPAEKDSVVVRVVAEQFKWNFHYAGIDGIFGKTAPDKVDPATNPLGIDYTDPNAKDDISSTKLVLAKDHYTILRITSKDVIHSFGVPHMRLKQDAIPGIITPVWFKPTLTTEEMKKVTGRDDFTYEIACSQLCGSGHASMKAFINVIEQADYDKWFASESAKAVQENSQGPAW